MKIFSRFLTLALTILVASQVSAHKIAVKERAEFTKNEFVYDLNDQKSHKAGKGGKIYSVTEDEWPVLEGQGVSMFRINLEPCGMNLLHQHPRPAEIAYLNKGSNVLVGFVEEDSGRMITNTMSEGQATLFPEALMHFQHNLGCEDAEFIAFFSSEDPGTVTIGAKSFKFPSKVVASSYGMSEEYVEKLRRGMPYDPVQASDECIKKCQYGKPRYEKEKKYDMPKYRKEKKQEKQGYERS